MNEKEGVKMNNEHGGGTIKHIGLVREYRGNREKKAFYFFGK